MACFSRKCMSFCAGGLNALLCFGTPIFIMTLHFYPAHTDGYVRELATRLGVPIEPFLLWLCCAFGLWLFPTLMLLHGIRKDRPNLMAPWIFAARSLIAVFGVIIFVLLFKVLEFDKELALGLCAPLALLLVILALCLVPVTMFYEKLQISDGVFSYQM